MSATRDESRTFYLDADDFDMLADLMQNYGQDAPKIVNEVIHASGDPIRNAIDPLIPVSGRRFKGHNSAARGSVWQKYHLKEELEITVGTIPIRRYLYFPDDGSNTVRHAGNQHFMLRGVEAAAPGILERAIDALLDGFERS
jgi:hypothetical protein